MHISGYSCQHTNSPVEVVFRLSGLAATKTARLVISFAVAHPDRNHRLEMPFRLRGPLSNDEP